MATASGKEEEPARGGRRERENAGARQAWAFRLALLRTLRWLEQERSAAAQQQQQQERGPAAASGINGPAGEPPAAPQQSAAPTGQAQQRSGDACWDPCFAAALDSVTQEDLWRAALALRQADDEAAAQHAGGPLDALDAARAAAAAATGAGGGAGSGGGVSAAAAPAGRGSRGPARPPTIMKSHEPCRDTTQVCVGDLGVGRVGGQFGASTETLLFLFLKMTVHRAFACQQQGETSCSPCAHPLPAAPLCTSHPPPPTHNPPSLTAAGR